MPIGLFIDSVTGEINGTIDDVASDSGPYTITVFADDGEGGVVSVTFRNGSPCQWLTVTTNNLRLVTAPKSPPNGRAVSDNGDDNIGSQSGNVTGVLSEAVINGIWKA